MLVGATCFRYRDASTGKRCSATPAIPRVELDDSGAHYCPTDISGWNDAYE